MDEMTMFADLRPMGSSLSEADLASIRAELFPTASRAPRTIEPGELIDLPAHRTARRGTRRPSRLAAAAAAIVAVGLGGLWLAIDRSANTEPEPALQQPVTTVPFVEPTPDAADRYALPRFAFAETGWTMTYASENTLGSGRAVVFLSDVGFDGPWVEVSIGQEEFDGGSLPTVDFGTISAIVSEFDDGSLLWWTDPDGHPIEAYGWQADPATVANLLATTTVTDGVVRVGSLPEGSTVAEPHVADAVGRYGSYQFVHTDGRTFEINLAGGGDRSLYSQTGGEDRTTHTVGGEDWLVLTYDGGERYRAAVLRDFWTWEFDGEPFSSAASLLDTVTGIRTIDEATWEADLPDRFISASDQPETVTELLAGVPLPDDFDVAGLSDGTTNDRYQFIAHVSGAVVCGWLDRWFTGEETSNPDLQAQAAAALATSHEWPMLNEIADQGGWSDVVWQLADAINGGDGVITGSGPTAPTRGSVNSSLGCEI